MINKLVEHMSNSSSVGRINQSSVLRDELECMNEELCKLEKVVESIYTQIFGPQIKDSSCVKAISCEQTLKVLMQDKRLKVENCVRLLDEIANILNDQLGDIHLYQPI